MVAVHLYDCSGQTDHRGECPRLISGWWSWACPGCGEILGDADPLQLERRVESHEYRAHKIVPAEFVLRA